MLTPGDSLFLHTDGVTEARRDGEFFGDERLLQALAAPGTPASLIVGLLEQVLDFQRQVPRDDIALLVVRVPE
ncbi:SpoIIE family protein phosphatase [Nocardioides piscis]|uniref:SpoIIE family protein phosphatase n=1 Tax=Nocardioides piscis TaxID=2714938 RepID=UPI00248362E4|nr:SpoIIE family protein phosphatase [Nocardioides piscis]